MKKLLLALSLVIIVVMALSSCTLDFSEEIDSSMEGLDQSIKDTLHPFLKEDEKYSGSGSTEDSSNPDINLDDYEVGYEVGNLCPSVTLQKFDGTGLLSENIDISKSGKVTVINFWGVWCPICLQELPYFDTTATEYKNDVTFYAIHTDDQFSISGGGIDYVNANYNESKIVFLKDQNTTGGLDDCYTELGGNGYYPYTLILDEFGIVTYTTVGKVPEATLIEEIEKALAKYEVE